MTDEAAAAVTVAAIVVAAADARDAPLSWQIALLDGAMGELGITDVDVGGDTSGWFCCCYDYDCDSSGGTHLCLRDWDACCC